MTTLLLKIFHIGASIVLFTTSSFRTDPAWSGDNEFHCSEELWSLARKDFGSLSKQQKNVMMRHFLFFTDAPPCILQFAVRQWPCGEHEIKPKLVLQAHTALLTYQGASEPDA